MEVKGKIKKFDITLYNKYDIPAREKIKKLLPNHVKDNPNIYEEDMILDIPNYKYKFLELQVCAKWINDTFPYDKPFVYARKKLFSNSTIFLLMDKHMTCGYLFDQKSLSNEPRRIKKYSRSYVYEVPWNRVLKVNLDDFDIETLKLYC
ncbi:MAG: hypothetical protein Hyperionvirus9_10 [Hyperionvirus sp.]|uniref:Uncharacterized protein n=1 Tax=Hyperionvirus sp. TaxID=2487770 RepID=A0A3G5ACI8_9VIRU|nr:MAG: hypothetical protein Hyperionvirus9_10 [Hyperionvirus sp.]